MSFVSISESNFIDFDSTLNLQLVVSPQTTIALMCSINKVEGAWQVKAQITCIILYNQAPLKFEGNLNAIKLEPMQTRTIGAWKEVFLRSAGDQWSLPSLSLVGNHGVYVDPVASLANYANHNLL